MLKHEDIRRINQIVEKAIRLGLVTKHHRYSLASALQEMKEKDSSLDLEKLSSSPSFPDLIRSIRS